MHQLGHTRTVSRRDHAVLTADTFVREPLPGMERATAIVHTAPAMGSRFTQYTAELEGGGSLGPAYPGCQRFVYVLSGEVTLELGLGGRGGAGDSPARKSPKKYNFGADGYAYL
ncbi:MAG: hypothetical protein ABIZ80_24810, partial [Bryobacteraceae bacterium]